MTLYYFGCWKEAGHFLHDPSGRFYGYRGVGPFDSRNLDTVYAPRRPPAYGEALATETNLVHTNGWTVLAMWDNSVDTRPGSNAAFIAEGEHDEAAMWALARQQYPWIVERLKAANVQRPVGAPARAAEWQPLLELLTSWRRNAEAASRLASQYENGGDDAGNGHAYLKERRIWTTCANELENLLPHGALAGDSNSKT